MKAKKDSELKVRVDSSTKVAFSQLAEKEALDVSDIVRRALREFLQRRSLGTFSADC